MDAELSRALAKAFNSPLWAYFSLGRSYEQSNQAKNDFIAAGVEAYTLEKLPERAKTVVQNCLKSYALAAQMFDGRGTAFLEPDELTRIAEALAVPVSDEEEA